MSAACTCAWSGRCEACLDAEAALASHQRAVERAKAAAAPAAPAAPASGESHADVVDRLKRAVEHLREHLMQYGDHLSDCPQRDDWVRPCDCGWNIVLEDHRP